MNSLCYLLLLNAASSFIFILFQLLIANIRLMRMMWFDLLEQRLLRCVCVMCLRVFVFKVISEALLAGVALLHQPSLGGVKPFDGMKCIFSFIFFVSLVWPFYSPVVVYFSGRNIFFFL